MPTTVAFDEVIDTRVPREVKGGVRWNTYFMQPPKGTRLPQAFLVENTPHRMLRTHYHDVDQFQVIVSGNGTLGKHPVRFGTVHFARAHTPYGPITAGDKGVAWLTIRARRDAEGAQFLPEKRAELEQAPGRNPWQISQDPEFLDFEGDVSLRAMPELKDDRGLGVYALRMKPHAAAVAPDASATGGQYLVVLRGSLVREGKEQRAITIGYVAPEEGPLEVLAGAEGLDALVLNFPRHDAPVAPTAQTRSPHALRTWRCALCAFVYDEAKGMPEDGIAPGTRWEDVPESWFCPDCAASKSEFAMVEQ